MLFKSGESSDLTDEALLTRHRKNRDTGHFGQLYNRYIPLIYGLCLKYLQHADKAQDAVMQLYEELAPKIDNYEIKVFRTWLYTVAKNHCMQILRKEKHEIRIDFSIPVMELDTILHLFDEGYDEAQFAALQKCIDRLPEPQRICITKFFLEEISYADVVDVTGFQLKSVKSYIQNGKRNLKICIETQIAE